MTGANAVDYRNGLHHAAPITLVPLVPTALNTAAAANIDQPSLTSSAARTARTRARTRTCAVTSATATATTTGATPGSTASATITATTIASDLVWLR